MHEVSPWRSQAFVAALNVTLRRPVTRNMVLLRWDGQSPAQIAEAFGRPLGEVCRILRGAGSELSIAQADLVRALVHDTQDAIWAYREASRGGRPYQARCYWDPERKAWTDRPAMPPIRAESELLEDRREEAEALVERLIRMLTGVRADSGRPKKRGLTTKNSPVTIMLL